MARDIGLEEMMRYRLTGIDGVSGKPMFGGWAWLLDGHLLCGARDDGAFVRLGKGNDRAALARPGVAQMVSRGYVMSGWVRITPETLADDAFAEELIAAAARFVRSLPPKRRSPF